MQFKKYTGSAFAGACAGAVNGLFGAGGGMVLVPLLTSFTQLDDTQIFPASVSIILPVCMVSLCLSAPQEQLHWAQVVPYLIGSAVGGVCAGLWGRKIPTKWLHRFLGALILYGGIRYLC